jgi:cysteinyl-tRNA synthetase
MRHRLDHAPETKDVRPEIAAAAERLLAGFGAALADDLNASEALAALFGFVREVNVAIDGGALGEGDRERVRAALAEVDTVLGVLDANAWRDAATDDREAAEIDQMVAARDTARAARDFATSDRLRDELAARGIVLEDTPHGTRWKRR